VRYPQGLLPPLETQQTTHGISVGKPL